MTIPLLAIVRSYGFEDAGMFGEVAPHVMWSKAFATSFALSVG
jgi:hypothetical protein